MPVLNRWATTCLLSLVVAGAVLTSAQGSQAPNTLSAAEKAAGWTLLFDGKTTAGWRGFHSDAFPESGWAIENGAIKTTGQGPSGGDIITVGEFYEKAAGGEIIFT